MIRMVMKMIIDNRDDNDAILLQWHGIDRLVIFLQSRALLTPFENREIRSG